MKLRIKQTGGIYYLFDKELSELDVIGNIHENPELIGDK